MRNEKPQVPKSDKLPETPTQGGASMPKDELNSAMKDFQDRRKQPWYTEFLADEAAAGNLKDHQGNILTVDEFLKWQESLFGESGEITKIVEDNSKPEPK